MPSVARTIRPAQSARKPTPRADEGGPAGLYLDAGGADLDPSPTVEAEQEAGSGQPDCAAARLAPGLRSASRSISSSQEVLDRDQEVGADALVRGRPPGLRQSAEVATRSSSATSTCLAVSPQRSTLSLLAMPSTAVPRR